MGYVVLNFEDGEYLSNEYGQILIFESRGLACQYMKETYQNPMPVQRTKRVIHYPKCYRAPFKVQRVC
ncbi:MAG: hypothetical protein Q4A90_04280 [Streptococcus sp.]|nr:hypothetical protein [Streptococcus sp.]